MSEYEVLVAQSSTGAELVLCSDGIVEVRLKPGVILDEATMADLLRVQYEVTPRSSFTSLLVDARPIRSMSRKAQEMAADNPVNDRTAALAIVVGSAVSTLLGNFFLRFARAPYKSRMFRDELAARIWLLGELQARMRS